MDAVVTPTRERILYATAELFRRQGYSGTGLKQVVAEAQARSDRCITTSPAASSSPDEVIRLGGAFFQAVATAAYDARSTRASVRAVFEGAAETLAATDFQDACPIATIALEVASTNDDLRRARPRRSFEGLDRGADRAPRRPRPRPCRDRGARRGFILCRARRRPSRCWQPARWRRRWAVRPQRNRCGRARRPWADAPFAPRSLSALLREEQRARHRCGGDVAGRVTAHHGHGRRELPGAGEARRPEARRIDTVAGGPRRASPFAEPSTHRLAVPIDACRVAIVSVDEQPPASRPGSLTRSSGQRVAAAGDRHRAERRASALVSAASPRPPRPVPRRPSRPPGRWAAAAGCRHHRRDGRRRGLDTGDGVDRRGVRGRAVGPAPRGRRRRRRRGR